MTLFVVLTVLGGLLVAAGVGMWDVPAGLLVAGVELIVGAYAGAYMRAKGCRL